MVEGRGWGGASRGKGVVEGRGEEGLVERRG